MTRPAFVTGCYRSGTTLLDKLAWSLDDVSIGSQPFTALYLGAKQVFNESLGIDAQLPFGTLFGEHHHAPLAFSEFLSGFDIAALPDHVHMALAESAGTSPDELPSRGALADYRLALAQALASSLGRPGARVVGEKEIVCEEVVPYLLAQGVRVVVVVRDPRDVVRSSHFGASRQYVGENRPVLFTLRTWRKSVAFAAAFQSHPNLRLQRFESLLADPAGTRASLARFLGSECQTPFSGLESLVHQRGGVWRANTSRPASGRFELPDRLRRFIETTCGPEMAALGYLDEAPVDDAVIEEFEEPLPVTHRLFAGHDVDLDVERNCERQRLERLRSGDGSPELHLFEHLGESLEALRGSLV